MKSSRRAIIFRIILFYFIISVVWITTSDSILFALVPDADLVRQISIYKGWAFVLVTAALLAGVLHRELKLLEAAHARIEESEQRFRLLYEDAPSSFQTLDAEGRILIVNRQWSQDFGFEPAQVVGRPFADLLTPSARERFQQTFQEMISSGRSGYRGELEVLRADGGVILTAVTGRVMTLQQSTSPATIVYFSLHNVTEQRALEIETRQQQEEYRQMMDAMPAMIYYLDANQVVVRLNQAAALQQHKRSSELTGKPIKDIFPQYAAIIDDGFAEVMQKGNPVLGKTYEVPGPDGAPRWVQVDRMPYLGPSGRPQGVVAFISDVTDHVRRERDLESLVDVAAALRGLINRADIYRITLQYMLDNLHLEGASVAIRAQGNDHLVIEAALGRWAQLAGRSITYGQGMSQRVVSSGQAELTQQVNAADMIDGQIVPDDLRAAGAVPLIADRHTLGALWVGSRKPIPEEDFRLLRAIADIAAAALHRTLLSDQTQLRLRRVSALHYIDMAISSSFDWHVTLNVLLGQALAMLGVDAAAILTYDAETQTLTYAAGAGFSSGEIQRVRLRVGESQAGAVVIKREVRFIPDLHTLDDRLMAKFLQEGEDFTAYCAAPLVGKGQVKGVLELFHRSSFTPDPEWMDFLEMLAAQAAIAIDNAELFENLQQSNSELRLAHDSLILGWSRALELRDAETQGHATRLVDLTLTLARRMHLPESQMAHLRRGVLLHDIGKMGIPDAILLKPGPLTEEEWQVMRQHPVYAFDLLSSIAYLKPAMDIPYAHHERWDGSGYPRGLVGQDIPLSARLFAVVDVWDALTHDRPYRKAWDEERAIEFLRAQAGETLDPGVVDEFLSMIAEG